MSLAEVVSIPAVLPHKNADKLEVVPLKDRQYITAKGQFQPGDKGILIQPGAYIGSYRPANGRVKLSAFDWLSLPHVVRPKKLRGVLSSGILMAPSELGLDITEIVEGTDLSDLVGIVDDEYYKTTSISGRPVRKPRCHRNHMPRSLKGWVRYLRYRVIG